MGEADELRRLRAEVTHLRMENDILKKAACHPRHANPVQTRQMILQLQSQTGGSIRQVCQAMGLPRSSFYHAAEVTPSSS